MRAYSASFTILGIAVAGLLVVGAEAPQTLGGACDSDCLRSMADSYSAALIAHDPVSAGVARSVRYTENTKVMRIGGGLWQAASGPATTFSICVPDPVAEQVGCLRTLRESGNLVLLALRLKVEHRQITEIEHIVVRSIAEPPSCGTARERTQEQKALCADAQAVAANLTTPRPGLTAVVPIAERSSRDDMVRFANAYYDAVVNSDGGAAPFADDCVRRENGQQTTAVAAPQPASGSRARDIAAMVFSLGCRDQINSRALSYIAAIDARRVEIADPETGLVFALAMFRRPMRQRQVTIVGVPGVDAIDVNVHRSSRLWAHVFKIRGGTIHEIEAGGIDLPLDATSGWMPAYRGLEPTAQNAAAQAAR